MKKLLLLSVFMIAAVCFVQNAKAQERATAAFILSMDVDKYIETTPNSLSFNFGITSHTTDYGPSRESLYGATGVWDIAYANCPLTITISGDNAAQDGKPRFARKEVGDHANGFDILPTLYDINFKMNGVHEKFYVPGSMTQSAQQFPHTKSYAEAPHNGQIQMDMRAYVNTTYAADGDIPARATLINSAFTSVQSADAGTYQCTMLVTFAAI